MRTALTVLIIAFLIPAQAEAFSTKTQKKAAAFAKKQVGKMYEWGATGPRTFDCSGLTYAAYKRRIPRVAAAQLASSRKIKRPRIGDLLFRGPGHVGIYVGNGRAVHATKTGFPVKYIDASYFTTRRTP